MSVRRLHGFHAVREALRAGTALRYIACVRGRQDARMTELMEMARAAGTPVRYEDRRAMAGESVLAEAEAKPVLELEELLELAAAKFLLALDGIEDPQNLGAIVRSASAAGVDGIILPSRRSVGLTPTVERVAAGALEHVRVARVGNLVRGLESCEAAGYWRVGLDSKGKVPLWEQDLRLPTVLVVGAEGKGLHELTRKRCDVLASIPLAAGVESLNASAAAAVALFEVVRQRRVL